ncbi:YbaB/EbfC family nucleoid-associated protein [Nocardia sp. NBC_00508]|uniref:YbaB/EbfC family nucleoid-associated protein n=1 Tax=Nocardia sp. NBC_00508 TaxID=2975992 RepID=UPI002E821635|nr:YbaB/EbfC family nucleoid-associated protein [Nocardia sp. NBC_00508]WUD68660.1 YbaB/EbfC family nucleoid-associated protein [Nocardia sp. NBC_00508]
MTNELAKAEMAALLEEVQEQMRTAARVQQERARLVGSASVRGKRVTVFVNADGTVIETKFGPGIEDLSYAEIAKAITEAAQAAAVDVARRGQQLMAPLHDSRARLPKLSDLIEGMPDFTRQVPQPPKVSTAPPGAAERQVRAAGPEDGSTAMEFSNVETYDHAGATDRGVTDSSW